MCWSCVPQTSAHQQMQRKQSTELHDASYHTYLASAIVAAQAIPPPALQVQPRLVQQDLAACGV